MNVCNQLGNCYLRVDELNSALDNFETSLALIQRNEPGFVNENIISKICSNIAMISGAKGYLNDCIKMHEKAL